MAKHQRRKKRATIGLVAILVGAAIVFGITFLGIRVAQAPSSTAQELSQPIAPAWRVPAAPELTLPTLDTLPGAPSKKIKNVVLLIADDLDWQLWNNVPRLRALQAQGTTLTNYVVTDSLCCPSRTSLFRGQYVHNHRVTSNTIVNGGGWPMYRALHYPHDCLPRWLQQAGARTALIGKYLNEFPMDKDEVRGKQPGWDTIVTPMTDEGVYTGYDYDLDVNGRVRHFGNRQRAFLNNVLNQHARTYLHVKSKRAFFLEFASYNPHTPSPVDPRNARSHAAAKLPRDAGYNGVMSNPPHWLRDLPTLTQDQLDEQDVLWGNRLRSTESIADSYQLIHRMLAKRHHLNDTLIVVTSDNGFHQATRGLEKGKRTPYATDTVVPLLFIGPGIPKGRTVSLMASETDLGATIARAMGAHTPTWVDGRSLWPLLSKREPTLDSLPGWRTAAFTENLGRALQGDPDYQAVAPPKYWALRTQRWLYVLNEDGFEELYDRTADPAELINIAASAPAATLDALRSQLLVMRTCSGITCRQAAALEPPA